MKSEERKKFQVDYILITGLILYLAYIIIDGFCFQFPDILALIWMIGSVILIAIGSYKTVVKMSELKKK